jgi:predicted ester cyclase
MAIKFQFCGIAVFALCIFFTSGFAQDSTLLRKNKELITRYIEIVVNGHDLSKKGDFFKADYIWHTMDGREVNSSLDSGHTAILRWLFNAIPDVRYTIDRIEAGGEMVGVSATGTGLANREMFGLTAGKRRVRFTQMFIYRIKDGKIVDQWEVVDSDAITAQLH